MDKLFRPRDANQLAKHIVDLATGQADESVKGKDPVAIARGEKGGKAKARTLTASERSVHARRMAETRWQRSNA